jgi:hypothetical protein
MRGAIDWCEAAGLPVRRCSPTQIRVDPLNFWPDTGSANINGSHALPERGLAAFQRLVAAWARLHAAQRREALETLQELGADQLWEELQKRYLL